jgi:PAS domain S-box-containing protein
LWINTTGVMNRYDGYGFKSYSRDSAHTNYPAGGFIHTIFKDRSGFLWVSSNESLDRFDPKTETTTRFPIDGNGPHSVLGPVTHVSQDRAGIMWLSTATGLHRLDPASGAFRHYAHDAADPDSLSNSLVRSTYEDREGNLWVCTEAGLDAFDRLTEKVTERIRLDLANSRQVKAFEDHAGVLWIIYAVGNGLASYDRHARRLKLYSFEGVEPPDTQRSGVEEIHEDVDGNLWLATRVSGLVKIDRNRRNAVRYRHSSLDPDSISEDFTKTVFEGREGNIWVGMGTTGLNRFERKPLPFKRYRHEPDNPQSLLETFVMAVYADRQENIWVGSPLGVTRIDGKSGEYSFFKEPGTDPANLSSTTSIVEDRTGYLWFGTYGGGLKRYDPRTGKFAAFRHNPADPHSLSHDIVYSLMVDQQGILWAGTDDGLNRLENPVNGSFRSWKGDPADPSPTDVRAMVEDSNRVLWLVSSTLERFDPATGLFTAYTFDPLGTGTAVRKDSPFLSKMGRRIAEDSFLAIDHSGMLWVATANGLLRFDPEREQFTLYDQRDGLPASAVNGILEDRSGNLWVSTAGGLSRFNPRTRISTNYYEADGLAGNAFEGFPAAGRSQRGQMFFGSKSGLTSFWPEQIVEKPYIPPVVLTGFSLRNLPVAPGPDSTLAKSISFTPSLTLSHAQNMFSFEFAALSYADPQRNQYRYMLEPLDQSWNRVDAAHRVATFTTLPAGHYTLRVQGSNNRGVWNEQGIALQLEILPPWWGTWWFRAVCAVILVAALFMAYQFRTRQLQQESRRLRDMIETIPAMAWTARPDGTNAFVNRRWAEYTGLSGEDAAGGWTAAVHPEDRQATMEKWQGSFSAGEPFEWEARFRCAANGEYRWFLARGVPLRDDHGNIRRWYGILTDIEDRKRAEEERRKIEADLAHINRVSMMGELAASIAHEVNQPLSGIVSNGSACLRWLAGGTPNVEEVREAVGDIVRDGKRAGEVIARIRALTTRAAPPSEALDVNQTIQEVLVLVRDKAKRSRVEIWTHFASDLAPVSGDRVQLQQVILNLVMNAIEAMNGVEDRPRELTISTLHMDADHVQISVADSGPGLDPDTANRIFEPFYTTKASGMGMGLSICRSILQNHGGRLWTTANDGRGTTFHFSLPKYKDQESHAGVAGM